MFLYKQKQQHGNTQSFEYIELKRRNKYYCFIVQIYYILKNYFNHSLWKTLWYILAARIL